ncbi:scarecrow-like protein 6 [Telopea speciosissima]|uniref:scarecrow-like protein 6 n=1 Tax=Telopea speciosissima TaxID=54955 RepID=UPI001CC4960E|nr:scarecrow-like protein 6 [Telopea speciosissima]XP_043716067.1 scarecrow-like protein 6 [Telopea speciosissima]
MWGMPFSLRGKGVLEVADISDFSSSISSVSGSKWKEGSCLGSEPTSVLDTRRSPSPPTSTSTLSSSLGGGGGSTDTAGVAAVSDNRPQKWPSTQQQEDSSAAVAEPPGVGGGVARKDEWASELQPIPTALEIVSGGGTGAEKCGLGMEDWESMLSESAASPGQEQSLLRWIMGDVEDPSSGLKQLLQSGGGSEFEANAGFGIVDQGFSFELSGGGVGASASGSGNVMGTINPSLSIPGSGFPVNSNATTTATTTTNTTNNNHSGRIGLVPNTASPPNYKMPCFVPNSSSNPPNSIFSSSPNNHPLNLPLSLPPGVFYQQQQPHLEPSDEKPQLFNPQLLINQSQVHHPQNPAFFVPLSFSQQGQHFLSPHSKRHHAAAVDPTSQIPKVPFTDSGQEVFMRRQQQQPQAFPHQLQLLPHHLQQRETMAPKPKVMGAGDEVAYQQQQQQTLVDQLVKAAELVETGNLVHARGILARLNQQLSPVGKPLQRAAFYFKEALQLLLLTNNTGSSPPQRNSTPFDVVLKIGAYKAFSEISPLLQFANFTCNQALLEVLDGYDRIHIIDFDIGLGGQWASFMQELAVRIRGVPSLKITAFASPSSHDPLELGLTRDNLTHFANDLGIAFELDIVSLDSIDPASWSLGLLHVSDSEAVAVNLPVGSSPNHPSSMPSLLRFVKQLSPKIVVSVDRACDRSDLPFSQHFLSALHSYSFLLDSLDAVNVNSDAVHKIEKFLFQPRIEGIILGRQRAPDKLPPWRSLVAQAGFNPFTFSNFTETQAECLVKRHQVRGFHVEKRQAALVLCWQRRELVSASAWRC